MKRFSYHRQVAPVMWGIIGVSVVEGVVISLVLHRWPAVAWIHAIVSILGLLYSFWYIRGLSTYQHEVHDDVVRLRSRHRHDIAIPRRAIDSVGRCAQNDIKRTLSLRDGVLRLAVGRMTNVRIRLLAPLELELPKVAGTVSVIEAYADEPAEFAKALATGVDSLR